MRGVGHGRVYRFSGNCGGEAVSLLPGILIANVAMALLAAVLMWRACRQDEDLRHARRRSDDLATRDPLTGLPNRGAFQARVANALSAGDGGVAILVMDVEEFKLVNDTHGHDAGDDLIRAMTDRISSCLGTEDVLTRLGGAEFAALVVGAPEVEDVTAKAREIDRAMTSPFGLGASFVQMNIDIGAAIAEGSGPEPVELLRRADVAMYVAKRAETAGCEVYSPGMDESLQLRRTISAELDAALSDNKLKLVYQPLVCARTGKVMSAEALMRWPGKEGLAGSPGVFIPIAEETGLITKLGEWALDQAVLEIKRQKTIPIAVNVSPLQFRVEGFADSVEAAVRRHGVDPRLLKIEITEGVLISHTEQAQLTMGRLREMGVQVLLDDFGTGYSSLSYLQKFEFDGLKIDRAFIHALEDGKNGQRLLQSIIALGHSLNMEVIAEGVETESQAAMLQLLRCDLLQGYALGRPDHADRLHVAVQERQQRLNAQRRAESA